MKTKGFTLIELLVVIAIVIFMMGTLAAALSGSRQTAVRLVCETNLTGIGRAMAVYAGDNNYEYPCAAPPGMAWSTAGVISDSRAWDSPDPTVAFKYGGTITSCFYLLIKYADVTPKQFLCEGDDGVQEFTLSKAGRTIATNIRQLWDFTNGRAGIWPGEFCSYSYHMPFQVENPRSGVPGEPDTVSFGINGMSNPASPVCADRNPHLDKNILYEGPGGVDANSAAHQGKGQNVLYKDGHVKFEKEVTCGINGDNIYTYGGDPDLGGGDAEGAPPAGNGDGGPLGKKDAYLVLEYNGDPRNM